MTAGGPEMELFNQNREIKMIEAKFNKLDSLKIKPREEELKIDCKICIDQIEND